MNTIRISAVLLATAFLARADVLPPVQDTSSAKGKLTPAAGKATTLNVSAKSTAFVLFDLDSLPLDVQPADIASARLRIYFPAVAKAGEIDVHTVTPGGALWTENTAEPAPGIDAAVVAMFPAETVKYQDLTPLLLNEFLKERRRAKDVETRLREENAELKKQSEALQQRLERIEARLGQQ